MKKKTGGGTDELRKEKEIGKGKKQARAYSFVSKKKAMVA